MKLTELFLNRWLYKTPLQDIETKDAVYDASNVIAAVVPPVAAGGAAQDINISNVTINGGQLTPGTYPVTVLDVSNWGWGQTCAFSSISDVQVNWGAGIFTSASGETYSISAGNTGTMAAKTYIYLDLNVSETAYQVTTNPSLAVGVGKVLIAVAQNDTTTATYNLSEATQIIGDNILANSINASKIVVGQLIVGTNVGLGTAQDAGQVTVIIGNTVTTGFINALNITAVGVITAGSFVVNTSGYIRGGQTDYNTGAGFFLGYSGGAYKFSIGNPTTGFITWDGTNMSVTGGVKWGTGDQLLVSADTIGHNITASPVKVKEILIKKGGTLRIKFDIRGDGNASHPVFGQVYRNAGAVGTLQTTTSAAYVNFSEDIGGWSAGDLVQLYVYSTGGLVDEYYRNFRIYVDNWESTTVVTD
jgi:hypothetical protein